MTFYVTFYFILFIYFILFYFILCDILCSVEYITYPKSFFIGFGKYFMTVTVKVFISVEFSRNHERYLIVNAPYRVQYGIDFPSSDFSYKYFPSLQARKIY